MRKLFILIVVSLFSLQTFSQCSVGAIATNALCNGQCNGTAKVTSATGTAPFTYLWSPVGQTTDSIGGLCPGTYTVTMTDDNACTSTDVVTVLQPSPLTLFTAANPNTSCSVCNGQAFAIAGGGTPPYTYLWSNSMTGASISSLCAGTYRVTATDANGCMKTDSTDVLPPSPPTVSANDNPASCSSCPDGSSMATPVGGSGPYVYSWSDGQTTQTATGLLPATYTVCVTDANDCSACATVTVSFLTAIHSGVETSIHIIPNPAINFISITGNFGGKEIDYSILNMVGAVIKKGSINCNEKIIVSEFPQGIYFLKIQNSSGSFIKKFVKQ